MAEIQEIRVPDIGDFDAVTIVEVLVKVGDRVAKEQALITLESDKATMEVPSPLAGVVRELKVGVGEKVGQDALILLLEAEETVAAPAPAPPEPEAPKPEPPKPEPPKPQPPPEPAKTVDVPVLGERIDEARFAKAYASPAVRLYARELGVNLGLVEGSGRGGRITREDVQRYVKHTLSKPAAAAGGGVSGFAWPQIPAIDFSKFGPVETKPLHRIRQLSAHHVHRSWLHVPHVTQFEHADVTEMEAFRKAQAEEAQKRGFKLTPLAFLLKASAAALKAFPDFCSSLDPSGESLILKHYVHVGVAVDTPNGLVVPVVRDVDQKGLLALAEELAALSAKAREGKLLPRDLQGACFTISSLGGIGGTAFTPIVNAPEVAILGVSRAEHRPVWDGAGFVPRLMLPLSLSYDHRVIDGASAARFIVHLAGLLQDVRRLLL